MLNNSRPISWSGVSLYPLPSYPSVGCVQDPDGYQACLTLLRTRCRCLHSMACAPIHTETIYLQATIHARAEASKLASWESRRDKQQFGMGRTVWRHVPVQRHPQRTSCCHALGAVVVDILYV